MVMEMKIQLISLIRMYVSMYVSTGSKKSSGQYIEEIVRSTLHIQLIR